MPEYIPTWRKPRKRKINWIPRPLFGLLSLVALGFIWVPWTVSTPLSIQLARGDWLAWIPFAVLMLVVLNLAFALTRFEQGLSSVFLLVVIVLMGYIASSDPLSVNHLFAFIALAVALCVWMLWIAHDFDEALLRVCAVCAVLAICATFISLGLGERLLITSALAFVNVLFYDHLEIA
ncbi:MAG: hypothetical protein ABL949_11645 [Fimbriimonadaceae bacterium]